MLRREFIILGGGVAVLPRAARAQWAIPVIGFLGSALQSVSESNTPVFRRRRVCERAIGGIRTGDHRMNELLEFAVSAHGGLERWKRIRSIDVSLIISGQLLEVKGFPEHQHTKVTIDADRPRTVMEPYGEEGTRGIYTPGRVWIEARNEGREIVDLKEPRASFAGHVRDTKWDQLQRLYFLGYAT